MRPDYLKTEQAIEFVKQTFTTRLSEELKLFKVSSPLVVLDGTGINDDLSGHERAVGFSIKALSDAKAVVVHSLAKWKRIRLKEFDIQPGFGILTDMKALRPDEQYTDLHSIYVDQWDWEVRIKETQRSLDYLKQTVDAIYKAIVQTQEQVYSFDPELKPTLPKQITYIHSEELLQLYPDLTSKEREQRIAKEYGAVFIIGIGAKLSKGQPHDLRAPDYDDWTSENQLGFSGLNGDIIVWHPGIQKAVELSSMGIRVNKEVMARQLQITGTQDRAELLYHSMILKDALPPSIGGGIGQSRLCMVLLQKKHIGQVQVGIWDAQIQESLTSQGIHLL